MTDTGKSSRLRYDEGCLGAHALNLVGDRWALLVVRELMFQPKRFQMIRAGLPGITASVLTQRLAQLVQAAVVAHDQVLGLYALSFWKTWRGLAGQPMALKQAALLTLAKIPNLLGMLTYHRRRRKGEDMRIIEYK